MKRTMLRQTPGDPRAAKRSGGAPAAALLALILWTAGAMQAQTTYNINTDGPITITADGDYVIAGDGSQTGNTITVNGSLTNVNVTLDNVNINAGGCAFDIGAGSVVRLALTGDNTLKSGSGKAGLHVPAGAELEITAADDTHSLTATGGSKSAGIGGGDNETAGRIKIAGGTVTASGRSGGSGIGGGLTGNGGDVRITGGNVTANGGAGGSYVGGTGGGGAGIGGGGGRGGGGAGGLITISGGTVTANGGSGGGGGAAGIGGGENAAGGGIAISGGTVTATGGNSGSGIGGGANGAGGGEITISGGTVAATAGTNGAGIGGGNNSAGGDITISGGTVAATAGTNGAGIGGGSAKNAVGTVVIDGGSVKTAGQAGPQPKNSAGADVFLNTLTVGSPAIADGVTIAAGYIGGVPCAATPDAPAGVYGIRDVRTTDGGKVYFYLTETAGDFETVALTTDDDETYRRSYQRTANVGDNVRTLRAPDLFITDGAGRINHPDFTDLQGDALVLTADGDYTITGVTTVETVRIDAGVTADITLDNLDINVSATSGACAFDIAPGAAVRLILTGDNELKSGENKAGLRVPAGAELEITAADDVPSLTANGGNYAAGIGGSNNETAGRIKIAAGTVTAGGSRGGAGIGGGLTGNGGDVRITGGTVTATGSVGMLALDGTGGGAAGIGGGGGRGGGGAGGLITITGGTVTATGGEDEAAGIGGGYGGAGGGITITGGTVAATGGNSGSGIGGGYNAAGGAITITGGTITATAGTYGAAIGGGRGSGIALGTVEIDGGSVRMSNHNGPQPKNSAGDNVYLNTLTLGSPTPIADNVTIAAGYIGAVPCDATPDALQGVYGIRDVQTIDGGKVYFYLTATGSAEAVALTTADDETYRRSYQRTANVGDNVRTLRAPDLFITDGSGRVNHPDFTDLQGDALVLTADGAYTIAGATTVETVRIDAGVTAEITLDNLNINVSATSGACAFDLAPGAAVRLILEGDNTLKSGNGKAGLHVPDGAELEITAAADVPSLTANGGSQSAGIGGDQNETAGQIKIAAGTVTATGGNYGAGIGGGAGGDGGEIAITGGDVTANGGYGGAGIGGGYRRTSGEIAISGGTVAATGGEYGAGIGGGYRSTSGGGAIKISGGTITADAGTSGAAIGGGSGPTIANGTVVIDGGSVRMSNHNGPQPKNSAGADVFLNILTTGAADGVAIAAGSINGIPCAETPSASAGVYGIRDVRTTDGGKVYFYLTPSGGDDEPVELITSDGDIYGDSYTRDDANANGGGANDQTLPSQGSLPRVTAVAPDGPGAPTGGILTIAFDRPMNPVPSGTETVALNGVSLTVSAGAWANGAQTLAIPYSSLALSTTYAVRIAGFKDDAGREMLADDSRSFTTGALDRALAAAPVARDFGPATYGYAPLAPQTFVIENTGGVPLTGLTATLEGPGAAAFEISAALAHASLDAGARTTVSVKPRDGLPAGPGAATLNVTDDSGLALALALDFAVNKATPTAAHLDVDLTGAIYDGLPHAIPVPTLVAPYAGLGAVTVKYAGLGGAVYPLSATPPVDAGAYAVTADIDGSGANFAAATGIPLGTLVIGKAEPTLDDLAFDLPDKVIYYDGLPHGVPATTPAADMGAVTVKYNGSTEVPASPGIYIITIEIAGNANYLPATFEIGRLVIFEPADPVVRRRVTIEPTPYFTVDPSPGDHYVDSYDHLTLTLAPTALLPAGYVPVVTTDRRIYPDDKGGVRIEANADGAYTVRILYILENTVVTITAAADPSAADDPNATEPVADAAPRVWSHAGRLYIASASTAGRACIYNVSGQLVKILPYAPGETLSQPLPSGLYVVAIEGRRYKLLVH